MNARQRVLRVLIRSKQRNIKYQYNMENWISGGWIPANVFTMPSVGGLSGLRRLRELKEGGIVIEHRYFEKKDKDGNKKKTRLTIYRLITPIEMIDEDNCSLKNDFNTTYKKPKFEAQTTLQSASHPLPIQIHPKMCKHCLNEISKDRKNKEFCSRSCKDKWHKAQEKKRNEYLIDTLSYYAEIDNEFNSRAKQALELLGGRRQL